VTAVIRAARGMGRGQGRWVGRRKLQVVIIGVVLLAATATSVVALGLLANANGPFDRAFARQNGADITAAVNPSAATRSQIAATTRLAGVTAAAGPYPGVLVTAQVTVPGVPGSSPDALRLTGRSSPGGPVDDLTLDEGHWPDSGNQIVMDRGTGVFPGSTVTAGSKQLTVVGVADSVTGTADAWVLPSEIRALAGPGNPVQEQMLYRFASAGSTSAITADIAELRAALPRGALLNNPVSYLGVRQSEQSNIAPWVPFIIAFGVIALVISVLIVVNVVSGAVTAGTARIGVLKSIGFTPAQVVASYVLLVAVPALAGCLFGDGLGNLLAIPLLTVNAHVYQVGALSVPFWIDVAVPLATIALTVVGAVPPALRAGRMSAIEAIASGRAPRPSHGYLAHRMLARISSLPRTVTLGLAAPFARPARTMTTVVAILFGAAAVTFGAGLALSLDRVVTDSPGTALPVSVSLSRAGPAQPAMTAAQQRSVVSVLAAQPGTLRYLTETDGQVSLPGLSDSASVTAYGGGNPAWSGYALISGRWYSGGAAEADVNTLFLTDTGTSVGSAYTLGSGRHRVTVRIVGQVFDPGKNLAMYLSPATLAAIDPGTTQPSQYDVAVRPGVSPAAYANAVSAALGRSYAAYASGGQSKTLTAVLALIAMLTILITVVAGLGVLNTVALQIRERAHEIGVFKSIGMTPRQTLAMIVCSVAFTGLAAGIVAIPAGVYLHHAVVPVMAHAANSGYPASLISVYATWQLVLLALAGLVIAVAGALGPAGWAAGTRTAFALRAE
jgi:putative ABC transport system permease protein